MSTEKQNVQLSKAYNRLAKLFDDGSFTELDRLKKDKNGEPCTVITAYGNVYGMPVYAFSQDSEVKSGGMNTAQAEKIARVYTLAAETGSPVIGIYDSKGADIGEGVNALSAYSKLIKLSNNISGVVPQISLVLGVCSGAGAVLANTADLIVMSNDALCYVTPQNVAGNKEVGTASLAAANGIAAVTGSEDEAVNQVRDILSCLPANNLSLPAFADYIAPEGGDNISSVVDGGSFIELFAEYGKNFKVGFARISGTSVGVVDTNGANITKAAALKAARFVRLCDAYSIPVVTLLNSKGILGTESAEAEGDVRSVSLLTQSYSEATNAKITVITGDAYGAVFTAMACNSGNADVVYALNNAKIGALAPETAVQFANPDGVDETKRAQLIQEYAEECSAVNAAAEGLIDDVISADEMHSKVVSALELLASKRVSTLDKKHTVLPL